MLRAPWQALLRFWYAVVATPRGARFAMLRDWVHRYGLAECGGVAGALAGAFIVRQLTRNPVVVAYAAAWCETAGYASVIVLRDLFVARRARRETGHRGRGAATRDHQPVSSPHSPWSVLQDLMVEFGPAGLMDTLVTRPMAMAAGVRLFGPAPGVIAGKVAADAVFYVPVILTYERRKRRRARGPE